MKSLQNFFVLSICCFLAAGAIAQEGNHAMPTGGWSTFRAVDEESKILFDKAMEKQVGVTYTPYCVSKQVVAGMNYRFFCSCTTVTNPPKEENAFVDLYVTPNGSIKEKNIHNTHSKRLAGGWSEFKPIDEKAKEVFAATFGKVVGVTYTPFCVSTQVVAGMNYRFLCSSVAATNPPKEGNAFGVVYADLQGNKEITEIKEFRSHDLSQMLQGDHREMDRSPIPERNRARR